ncbi:NAD(P)-binding protein [Methylobacterium sp. J-030]|uniref:NAD(P)/FAD-dependent oxidoreductase n=1 Tax=Methylobacterium sp. J-030 TaxID=2836627 RepID=UPI001FB917BD|nr:NAD(P)-binding protein [Methylobacterium sp. J-030]MCJ2070342.1 NAD(P)-binding protein [Methylobacterium sp. J-030]
MSDCRSVAILGAGMAGAAVARRLADAGLAVQVFDKGRTVGGRMATRRDGTLQFDHGAQFMRAHGPAFEKRLEDWAGRGIAAPWAGAGRRIGIPDMTAPVRDLLTGLSVASRITIARIARTGSAWYVETASNAVHGPFDAVAITFPAPQGRALLDRSGYALPGIERAAYAPCWSLMVAAENGVTQALIEPRADPIALIAADASKPGRPPGSRLTIHATADWSRNHLEDAQDAVAAALLPAAEYHLGLALRPSYVEAHRWRYAQVEHPLGRANLYDPTLRLGAAGDWCLGARIEAAYDSGSVLATAILADFGGPV